MAVEFVRHTLPKELLSSPRVKKSTSHGISLKLEKQRKILKTKMKAIDKREKGSWLKSLVRG